MFCFILLNISLAQTLKPVELRYGISMEIATLDPNSQTNDFEYIVASNLYDTLIYPDNEKGYIPWLAESWTTSPDGEKFTFKLKKGVPFHDGSEITAEDVAFSMERLVNMGAATSTYFKSINPGSTKVLDKYTVEFNLTKRDPSFMQALFLFKIMNKKVLMQNKIEGKYGQFGDYGFKYLQNNDAGSGPYKVIDHKFGNLLRMERFEKYPFVQWKKNSIQNLSFHIIPEMVTLATKLKAGDLDMGASTVPVYTQKELKNDKNFVIQEDFIPAPWFIIMNNKKKPLDDVYVRKAIAHAYDFKTVTTQIEAGGKPLHGPLPDEFAKGCTDVVRYDFDLEKAKEMLKKSKYSEDELKKIEMEIAAVAGSERFKSIALHLSTNLKKIGLNLNVKAVRWPDICQFQRKPETAFHMVVFYQMPKIPHAHQILVFYTPEGWGTPYPAGGIYYNNPKVTELIEKGNNTFDQNEQRKYYCQAEKIIAEESPVIFSHTSLRLFPFWRYLKDYNYPVGAMYFDLRFERLTMDTEDPMFKKNQKW